MQSNFFLIQCHTCLSVIDRCQDIQDFLGSFRIALVHSLAMQKNGGAAASDQHGHGNSTFPTWPSQTESLYFPGTHGSGDALGLPNEECYPNAETQRSPSGKCTLAAKRMGSWRWNALLHAHAWKWSSKFHIWNSSAPWQSRMRSEAG